MRLILVLAAGFAALASWISWPAPVGESPQTIDFVEFGEIKTGSTMLLVEPLLSPHNYRNADSLYGALSAYLEKAKASGWRSEQSVVVFPEYVGTWLAAAKAPPLAYRAKSLSLASVALILDDPISFARSYLRSSESDRFSAALFRARGAVSVKSYSAVFSRLARDFDVAIVAGSTILEEPWIENGALMTSEGALRNVSAVFDSTGALMSPLIVKRHLIPSERLFAVGGDEPMPVFETPAGRLGVLICADAWHPALYEELRARNADMLAVPAFLAENESWNEPWRGYVTPTPADARDIQVDAYTEGEAWEKFSLPGRIALASATVGGVAFLRSGLWDLQGDGRTLAVSGSKKLVGVKRDGGAVTLIRF